MPTNPPSSSTHFLASIFLPSLHSFLHLVTIVFSCSSTIPSMHYLPSYPLSFCTLIFETTHPCLVFSNICILGQPSQQPSMRPSMQPSQQPTSRPSKQPTQQPSMQPSQQPTSRPSMQPSQQPTMQPSQQPTSRPSMQPSQQPTSRPSRQPTQQPSMQPSQQPSSQPSGQPSQQPTGNSCYLCSLLFSDSMGDLICPLTHPLTSSN